MTACLCVVSPLLAQAHCPSCPLPSAASISLLSCVKPLSRSAAAFGGAKTASAQRPSCPGNGDAGAGWHPQSAAHGCGVSSRSPPGRRQRLAREGSPGSRLKAGQGCITRRQARQERENANNRPGQKGGTVPPSCTASCSLWPPVTQGMLLLWDHPVPPQPQRTDPVSPGAQPAHGDSRALGGTGAPNSFPKASRSCPGLAPLPHHGTALM